MSIRQLLGLFILIVGLFLSALSILGTLQLQRNMTVMDSMMDRAAPSALEAADLSAQFKDVQLRLGAVVRARDADLVASLSGTLREDRDRLTAGIASIEAGAASETETRLMRQARESIANYFAAIDETLAYMQRGQQLYAGSEPRCQCGPVREGT